MLNSIFNAIDSLIEATAQTHKALQRIGWYDMQYNLQKISNQAIKDKIEIDHKIELHQKEIKLIDTLIKKISELPSDDRNELFKAIETVLKKDNK